MSKNDDLFVEFFWAVAVVVALFMIVYVGSEIVSR